MPTRLDQLSLVTVPLQQRFRDLGLGHATGFVWLRHDRFYLITNWHVVSGRNNETGETLHRFCAEPNILNAKFRVSDDVMHVTAIDIALKDEDNAPIWLHHPVHRRKIDIVAIPLDGYLADTSKLRPINYLKSTHDLFAGIGMDVFVIGYPFEPEPHALPVWKRGSLASEPELVRLAENFQLIDTASRPGMSGSPVILRSYGVHLTRSGPSLTTEPATKFIGVYSGRLHTSDASDAQLGRVWPESWIMEIIDANMKDDGLRD